MSAKNVKFLNDNESNHSIRIDTNEPLSTLERDLHRNQDLFSTVPIQRQNASLSFNARVSRLGSMKIRENMCIPSAAKKMYHLKTQVKTKIMDHKNKSVWSS